MKRPSSARTGVFAAVLAGWGAMACAAPPEPLVTLRAVHALSNAEANKTLQVAFEGSVTYYKKGDVDLFVQDGDLAIYVEAAPTANLEVGDRVLVRGTTRASFRPEVLATSINLLRHGTAPDALPATFKQLIGAQLDCRRVTVRAVVRSANIVLDGGLKNLYLQLLMDGGNIDAEVVDNDSDKLEELLDSEVEITGAVAGRFDSKMQMTGILLEVPSLSDVKILKRANTDTGSLPATPMDEILGGYDVLDRTQRIRVQGTMTYYQPGLAIVLESGAKSLWISTQFERPLHIGELASVTGFPDVRNGSLILTQGEVRQTGIQSPIAPQPSTPAELALGAHAFDLVSVEGRLLMSVREAAQDEYVLVSDGHLFSAVFRHPERGLDVRLPPMKQVPLGSMIRVSGICVLDRGDKFRGPVAFDVLMRSPEDVAVVAAPPLVSVRNLILLVGLLLLVLIGVGARGWHFERRARRQTAELAEIEHRRSLILEKINGSSPLPEIIERIKDLVSFKLKGAQCWCEGIEGAQPQSCPPSLNGLRVASKEIPARAGLPHGIVCAAFDSLAKPLPVELETLSTAAELAALAIETRRLYSDLLHRSEFDQLTEIHNRFSLEKHLDSVIEDAGKQAGIFGLIYVDLDGFKQINDLYGHQVGDLFLQNVALRMKHQIRPADMLARLGGDEFAVVLPCVHSEKDVEEIALRLDRCFEDPFAVDGHALRGSASLGIALYPRDGATRDRLLNAADAAMYMTKHAKRKSAPRTEPTVVPQS